MTAAMNGNISFWYADIGGVPGYRNGLPGNIHADVCIVGAGFTGLWTAYYLKKAAPSLLVGRAEVDRAATAVHVAGRAGREDLRAPRVDQPGTFGQVGGIEHLRRRDRHGRGDGRNGGRSDRGH